MEQLEEGNMYTAVPVKYLLFAVDGTAATEPHWKTIFSDYLEKIIRINVCQLSCI
ncbi:hypothetical protein TIFTF001_025776 [Ficus carica]|uniref:Uncharacterized protein n=1 Tax=Ficus carica TaxID=3494 RepID=A0AA88DEH6_FICCA|nr:hypothetical protein TIFTF001_025776 [Ficus carica]